MLSSPSFLQYRRQQPLPARKAGVRSPKAALQLMGETASGDGKKTKLFLTSEASFSNSSTLAGVELYA